MSETRRMTQVIAIRLTPEQREFLKLTADQDGVSLSELIRDAALERNGWYDSVE